MVTAQAVVEFGRRQLRLLAEKCGGERTLNEMRVMNQVILCSLEGHCCGVTNIHKVTGIPILLSAGP